MNLRLTQYRPIFMSAVEILDNNVTGKGSEFIQNQKYLFKIVSLLLRKVAESGRHKLKVRKYKYKKKLHTQQKEK